MPTPVAVGHRGAAGEAPENTLACFELALRQGASIIEADVRATRDGAPVLIHDETVDRTTEGSGKVRELDCADLQRLDAGFRFAPQDGGRCPYRGKGLHVPTVAEALAAFPAARFTLHLKETGSPFVERVLDAVAVARHTDRTLLATDTDEGMRSIRRLACARRVPVATSASAGEVRRFLLSALLGSRPPLGPMALQIPTRYHRLPLVSRKLLRHAHAHGIPIHVWTINDPVEIERLLELGVDGIVSDFPARVSALIGRRARQRLAGLQHA